MAKRGRKRKRKEPDTRTQAQKLESCVLQLKKKWYDEENAITICKDTLSKKK